MLYLSLFLSFMKISFCSFGGYAMMSLINEEMVKHAWLTTTEVADIFAIAEMTPGSFSINCATFAGMKVAGIPGALSATAGILMPSLTLCLAVAVFFEAFKQNEKVEHILQGVRPASLGMLTAMIVPMIAGNLYIEGSFSPAAFGIMIAVGIPLLKKKITIAQSILIAAVLGLLLT